MAFEPGEMSNKLGNRYEGRWVAKQLLRLINEEISSVTVAVIGPDERGVDLQVTKKDGTRQLQQCKARCGSNENWTIARLAEKKILDNLKEHLSRDQEIEFALVTAIPFQNFADICESARNSDNDPKSFYQYAVLGQPRNNTFNDFCNKLGLDPTNDNELAQAFSFVKRTHIVLEPDNQTTKEDLLTRTSFLLTGETETAISALLTFAEDDNYRQPIYVDKLRQYLIDKHQIRPKNLAHNSRLGPAVEELKKQFKDSIQGGLIGGNIIPRAETTQIIESIEKGYDVIVHGAAGYGKTGVIYELTELLYDHDIVYLPIRLDTRIPVNNAKQFGEDLGLPDSPVFSLTGLAGERRSVLILDQLDAIRWTAAHSSAAIAVCNEMVRQVQSLRKGGKNISLVFACRSFDMENDPELRTLVSNKDLNSIKKISINELTKEQLKNIIGSDIDSLSNRQKNILSCPLNLAIWIKLNNKSMIGRFKSATELMRLFWEDRRRCLDEQAGISGSQVNSYLEPILDYVETKGAVSAPASLAGQDPRIRNALISFGILQPNQSRIIFFHQSYLDYLIAERLLRNIHQGTGSVIDWLGSKSTQSLFRREQLRQVFSLLSDDDPREFFRASKELLESDNVRFHLKHLVLELFGQMEKIDDPIGSFFLKLLDEPKWTEHIHETVLFGHQVWIIYLLDSGAISEWLNSPDDQLVGRALWLLRSVAEYIPDEVTGILSPYLNKGEPWPSRIYGALCWKEVDDSEKMFELRLQLTQMGHVRDYVDWKSLCTKYPIRALQLLSAILSVRINSSEEGNTLELSRQSDRWFKHELTVFYNEVERYPLEALEQLLPHVVHIAASVTRYQRETWRMELGSGRDETNIILGTIKLVTRAGSVLAAEKPEVFISLIESLQKNNEINSSMIENVIIAAYADLPDSHADAGINWLLDDSSRFRLGSGYYETEWAPAVELVTSLSSCCSDNAFKRLEDAIVDYHAPEELADAKHYLEWRRKGKYPHFWGKTQYFLLPALDSSRTQPATKSLLQVLNRKFDKYDSSYFVRGGGTVGGVIGSKLTPNLTRISDKAWLGIVTSKKVTEQDNNKWVQAGPDRVLTTSIRSFSQSLANMSSRFPERFGQLSLQFPDSVHPWYISAVIRGLSSPAPGDAVPEEEKDSWLPASIETIVAVLDKYQSSDSYEAATSFCRLIAGRPDECWSKKTIEQLVRFSVDHPDPEPGKLNVYTDKNIDEATVDILFQNTINCVRGVAAETIGRLLWENSDYFEQVRPGIESLVSDPHPVVRMASIEAIKPVFRINKDLAVQWFCAACSEDLRVAASYRAIDIFNYTVPGHIDQVGPIIQAMVVSGKEDIAKEGARQVTARHLFDGLFRDELAACIEGSLSQRIGVANIAASFLSNEDYSGKCQAILLPLMNDPEKEVRDELRAIFRKGATLLDSDYADFINEYSQSNTFEDDPLRFIRYIKDIPGSLVSIADAILAIIRVSATTIKERAHDSSTGYPYMGTELISILLRLYEQGEGEQNRSVVEQCLDVWDLLFENRINRAVELTRAIER